MRKQNFIAVLPALMVLFAAGCGSDSAVAPSPVGASGGQLRMETYCAVEGLSPALRQTFVVVEERALEPVAQAEEFAQKNQAVRDAVMAFADPVSALEAGRVAARERITLMIAPVDGSAPRQVFTGCLPGLTAEERMAQAQGESKVSNFFTGGTAQKIGDDVDRFRATIAGALIQAARSAPAVQDSEEGALMRSLSAVGQVFRSADAVPRIVLVSGGLPPVKPVDMVVARGQGMADAGQTRMDLGNAEVMVIAPGGNSDVTRAYWQAFLLRQGGQLTSWSTDSSGLSITPSPVRLQRFSGTAAYPGGGDDIVQLRIATDPSGKLANSWLVLTGAPFDRAIPLTGQAVCDESGACRIRSDRGGFAQAWVAGRGDEPRFDNDAPFGGMREWSFDVGGTGLKGDVFDSAVSQVGPIAGKKSIEIKAVLQQKANF